MMWVKTKLQVFNASCEEGIPIMLWVLNKLHVNVKGDSCWCELIDQSINHLFGKQFHANAKGYSCWLEWVDQSFVSKNCCCRWHFFTFGWTDDDRCCSIVVKSNECPNADDAWDENKFPRCDWRKISMRMRRKTHDGCCKCWKSSTWMRRRIHKRCSKCCKSSMSIWEGTHVDLSWLIWSIDCLGWTFVVVGLEIVEEERGKNAHSSNQVDDDSYCSLEEVVISNWCSDDDDLLREESKFRRFKKFHLSEELLSLDPGLWSAPSPCFLMILAAWSLSTATGKIFVFDDNDEDSVLTGSNSTLTQCSELDLVTWGTRFSTEARLMLPVLTNFSNPKL